jgi:hypothetical protein
VTASATNISSTRNRQWKTRNTVLNLEDGVIYNSLYL